MARKNPLGKIKDAAFDTLKHPVGTAEKAVGQAGRTAAVGRMVAGQVARTAVEKASEGIEAVVTIAARGHGRPVSTGLRPVPPVEEPASSPVPDPDAPAAGAKRTSAPKVAATKMPATKVPAKKAAIKKAAKKAPAKKAAAKKAVADATPEVTPADVAKNIAKKTPATKTPAKTAAKKTAAKKTAQKASAAPRTAEEVADVEGPEVTTPVGTAAADVATNPDTTETDLQQPGTEPLIDPATTKAVASEAETLQKAADPDKG